MLSVADAQARMLNAVGVLPAVRRPIREALGCALAEHIYATEDSPPFANSAMDGFAVRAADVADAAPDRPIPLRIVETIPAGAAPARRVVPGSAARIMTGAMLPNGADAVVMVEDTRASGDTVHVRVSARLGQHIRLAGESVRVGELVLEKGTCVRPAEMAMLAALNVGDVPVTRPPRVGILSTGDELTPVGEPLKPGKIRDSNRYGLYGQVLEAGAEPVDLGIAGDDRAVVEEKIREGAAATDALVTSGGVSVGEYDVVRDVLEALGRLDFWRVAMKPGKPQAFGEVLGKPVFALPGNPVSSMVVFELFVRPALRRMAGHRGVHRPTRPATIEEDIRPDASGRTNFLRAVLTETDGRLYARTTGDQGSGVLRSLVLATGLIVVGPAGARAGSDVQAILTDWR
jgi:molybdopterin molybdotransferase